MECQISINVSKQKKDKTVLAGTLFAKKSVIDTGQADGTTCYLLTIIGDKDKCQKAALVNMATGKAIRKLVPVASDKCVTADELAAINFQEEEPVLAITED
jgi:hypothetical protein